MKKKDEDVKKEYLKRVNSPVYMKRLKKNIELLRYYRDNFNPKIDTYTIRSVAKYFSEDVKNPIPKYVATSDEAEA